MKSVLITGITCYIGRALAERLATGGVEVSGLVRAGSRVERLSAFADRLTLYETDGSQASLDEALQASRPDAVIHLAGYYVFQHTAEQAARLVDTNVLLGTRLLEAAKRAGVSKWVNAGSHFQYFESPTPRPLNLYAVTKQAFQDILSYYGREEGLDYLNLIIFESYGPGDWRSKLIQAIAQAQRKGEPLGMVAGDPVMDFAYIDDIVGAFIHAARLLQTDAAACRGGSFALSGGERLKISRLVKVFEEVGGRPIATEPREDPPGVRRVFEPWQGPSLPGWSPKIPLREGVRRFLDDVNGGVSAPARKGS